MIEFDHVTRKYGEQTAVDNLALTIAAGEVFALLGPNGAGKTTSIKMLVGLLRPTHGTVRVCGRDLVAQTRDANRLTGYVPDQPFLYDKLTGRELLKFIAEMYGLDGRQAAERIEREIERFGLADFVGDLTERYSHGMKQRMVFAAALLHDPAVLVLDEPMVGLDPHSIRLVKDLLKQQAAAGVTVLMSTHTLEIVEEVADRIGVINDGRLDFTGSIGALRQQLDFQTDRLEPLYLRLMNGVNGQGGLAAKPRAAQSQERLV